MDIAKLFLSGHCQAVRLPKQYRFPGNEVAVKRFGNGVLLLPIDDPMADAGGRLAGLRAGICAQP
jgi:antitoxin VapB